MKPWRLALLIFELALFAVILIHPLVNLPDVSFHGGTAPVALRTRHSTPPVTASLAGGPSYTMDPSLAEFASESFEVPASLTLNTRLSLECALRC